MVGRKCDVYAGATRQTRDLGRAMVFWNDDKSAQVAYSHAVRHIKDQCADFGGLYCSGCRQQITVNMGLHVCRQCVGTDLCGTEERNSIVAKATAKTTSYAQLRNDGLSSPRQPENNAKTTNYPRPQHGRGQHHEPSDSWFASAQGGQAHRDRPGRRHSWFAVPAG